MLVKIDAVGVISSNLRKTVGFYSLLGFVFPEFKDGEQHLEPIAPEGSARLMIDSREIIKEILGVEPKAANHSGFAVQYETAKEIDLIVERIKEAGFAVVKEPWDAFWGQRYAIVEDPDGYKVDLYAKL